MCPECQRPAAVGVQCVDCVRELSKNVRGARTVFGGAATARPIVTQAIIGLCLVVFVLQYGSRTVTAELAYSPGLSLAEPWRFLTAAFLHSTSFPLHIAFNMYALWLCGPYLEGLFGRLRFAVLYLVAALGGSVGYFVLANPESEQSWFSAVVGASGAVFGLFGALVVVNRRLGRDTGGIIAMIVINGALPLVIPSIAWQAHLGGLVTGAAVAAVLAYAPRSSRLPVQVGGVLAVVILLLVLTALKVASVPAGLFA